jgi:general secretion pathway protein K
VSPAGLPHRQRGMAMLVAILLVALGTIIAAAVAYESAMTARRATATFAFDEGILVAQGAEAFAAYGLRTFLQSNSSSTTGGGDIYPGQGWDQPVSFEVAPGIGLDAQLQDLQGRFNLNWLGQTVNNQPNPQAVKAFNRLLAFLQIEPKWTDMIVDWIDQNQQALPDGAEDSAYLGQNPPYLTANQFITSTSELLALPGFGRENYEKLAPYITALPPNSKFNICTAHGKLLDAFTKQEEYGHDEAAFEKNRQEAAGCFPPQNTYGPLMDASASTGGTPGGGAPGSAAIRGGTSSVYFRLTSRITIGTVEFNLYSLLYVDSSQRIHVLLRSYTPD